MKTVNALLADKFEIAEETSDAIGIQKGHTLTHDQMLLDFSLTDKVEYAVFDSIPKIEHSLTIPIAAMNGAREKLPLCGFDGYIS